MKYYDDYLEYGTPTKQFEPGDLAWYTNLYAQSHGYDIEPALVLILEPKEYKTCLYYKVLHLKFNCISTCGEEFLDMV